MALVVGELKNILVPGTYLLFSVFLDQFWKLHEGHQGMTEHKKRLIESMLVTYNSKPLYVP